MRISLFSDLVCPICLNELDLFVFEKRREDIFRGTLSCKTCDARYSIKDGLPYLILSDKNWTRKKDEIKGEMLFLYKELPTQTRIEYGTFESLRTKFILDRLKINGLKVLNVGCQMCIDSYLLVKEYNCNVYSLDIEPATLIIADDILNKNKLTTPLLCADGEWLPFKNETFDMVFCRQTLHHFPNIERGLEEFFRVTKINGLVVVVDEPITGYFRQKITKLLPGFLKEGLKNMLYDEHGTVVEDLHEKTESGAGLLSHSHIKSTLNLEKVISVLKKFTSNFSVLGSYGKLWLERNKDNVIITRYKSDSMLERILREYIPTIFSESTTIIAKKTVEINRNYRSERIRPVNPNKIKFHINIKKESKDTISIFKKIFKNTFR